MERYSGTEMEITIDREFQNLIPAMSEEERKQLEENIVEFRGARDPLTVWLRDDDYVLLDGHNRYEICKRLGLPFDVEQLRGEIPDRDAAMDWIDRNQLGRRNLSKQDYKLLLGRRYNRAKKSEGAPKGNANAATKQPGQNAPVERTSEKLAREHGVDEKTVRRAGKFQAAAEKLGIEKEIASGKVKATEAEVVKAAATLPKKPSPEQLEHARQSVSGQKRQPKNKQTDKPTAGETRRTNDRLARKATLGLIAVRAAVEKLAQTDSTFRDSTLDELKRCMEHLSQPRLASKAKPEKQAPGDELREAVAKRWDSMRLWGKHWGIADMKDVRRLFVEMIRDEQKQFDK